MPEIVGGRAAVLRVSASARIEDVVPRHRIVEFVTAEDIQAPFWLQRRVVEDEAVTKSRADALAVDGQIIHAGLDHHAAGRILVRDPAFSEDIAKDIERAHRSRRGGDMHERVMNVVAPDPYVPVSAFA